MQIKLRTATPSEAEALADLRVAAMRPSLEALGRFDPVRARERFLSSFCAQDTQVIERDGQQAGVLVLRSVEGHLLLDHLYIAPEHQACGLGSEVLKTVFRQADAQRRAVRVGALKGSRANAFYARHGFKQVEQTTWDNHYVRAPCAA